jgi:hypothetical protein
MVTIASEEPCWHWLSRGVAGHDGGAGQLLVALGVPAGRGMQRGAGDRDSGDQDQRVGGMGGRGGGELVP